MDKKVCLITGIGGSIGIHMYGHVMTHTDWDVVGVDSFRHKGWTDRISEDWKTHPDRPERTRIVQHDLTAPFSELMKNRIGKVDYIIHLASLSDVEVSIQDPVNFFEKNVSSTLNTLEFAREAKPEVFIMFSTDEVYGPTTGKDDGYTEWASLVPSNPYAGSKAAQEMAAIAWWRSFNVPVIITNTMNNFAEMQQASKYPVMIQKWIANGEKITVHGKEGAIGSRSYIHSRNVADAVLFLIKNCPPHLHVPGAVDKPDRYHIAGDKQVDNLELVQLIGELMAKEPIYELVDHHSTRPGHDPHYGLNADKLKNLGWKSPVSFEESLKNTIEWQTNHSEWIK